MMFMLILAPVLSTVMDVNITLYPSVHFPHQFISERNHGGLSVFQKELALTGCCFTRAHFLFMVLGVSVVIFALMVTSSCGYDFGTELPRYADLNVKSDLTLSHEENGGHNLQLKV